MDISETFLTKKKKKIKKIKRKYLDFQYKFISSFEFLTFLDNVRISWKILFQNITPSQFGYLERVRWWKVSEQFTLHTIYDILFRLKFMIVHVFHSTNSD